MLRDQHLELGDKLATSVELEVGRDPRFQRAKFELLQACDLRSRPAFILDVGERWPAPQCKRSPQRSCCLVRSLLTRATEQALELRSVRLIHPQQVAGPAPLDRALRKGPPQLRDTALTHFGRRGRSILLPHQVAPPVTRD